VSEDITCRQFADFLMGYLDGEISDAERAVFDAHMAMCPPCVTYLETYRETVRLGRSLCEDPDGPVPDEVPEGLVEAVLRARTRG
jgi:anti-sigma factor RsiW